MHFLFVMYFILLLLLGVLQLIQLPAELHREIKDKLEGNVLMVSSGNNDSKNNAQALMASLQLDKGPLIIPPLLACENIWGNSGPLLLIKLQP